VPTAVVIVVRSVAPAILDGEGVRIDSLYGCCIERELARTVVDGKAPVINVILGGIGFNFLGSLRDLHGKLVALVILIVEGHVISDAKLVAVCVEFFRVFAILPTGFHYGPRIATALSLCLDILRLNLLILLLYLEPTSTAITAPRCGGAGSFVLGSGGNRKEQR
jgi:hypothetical protein